VVFQRISEKNIALKRQRLVAREHLTIVKFEIICQKRLFQNASVGELVEPIEALTAS
jgi:hypothetical protein